MDETLVNKLDEEGLLETYREMEKTYYSRYHSHTPSQASIFSQLHDRVDPKKLQSEALKHNLRKEIQSKKRFEKTELEKMNSERLRLLIIAFEEEIAALGSTLSDKLSSKEALKQGIEERKKIIQQMTKNQS